MLQLQQFSVSSVLLGSQRLDQMRFEISQFIPMVIGLVSREDIYVHRGKETLPVGARGGASWVIYLRFSEGTGADCEILDIEFRVGGYAWKNSTGTAKLARPEIVRIHDSLQFLLDGLVEAFPHLRRDLNFFQALAGRMRG